MSDPRLLLVDGNNLVMRSYHATIAAGMTNPDGVPSGALFGTVNTLRTLLRELDPTHMLWCFDHGGSEFRTGLDPDYKGHRKTASKREALADPARDLPPQFDALNELLDLMGVRHYSAKGVEADDLIANVVHSWRGERVLVSTRTGTGSQRVPLETVIVSGDHDLFQLVGDGVRVLRPGQPKAVSGMGLAMARSGLSGELFDEEAVTEKYGLPPSKLAEMWALTGDGGDNVKGIPGVGPKTAAKWLREHKDLWTVLWREDKCAGYENTCRLAYELVRLDGSVAKVPLRPHECALPETVDPGPLLSFFDRWQMRSIVDALSREGSLA